MNRVKSVSPLVADASDGLLTLREAAALMRWSVKTVQRRIWAGRLDAYRDKTGTLRVREKDLKALLSYESAWSRRRGGAAAKPIAEAAR